MDNLADRIAANANEADELLKLSRSSGLRKAIEEFNVWAAQKNDEMHQRKLTSTRDQIQKLLTEFPELNQPADCPFEVGDVIRGAWTAAPLAGFFYRVERILSNMVYTVTDDNYRTPTTISP